MTSPYLSPPFRRSIHTAHLDEVYDRQRGDLAARELAREASMAARKRPAVRPGDVAGRDPEEINRFAAQYR